MPGWLRCRGFIRRVPAASTGGKLVCSTRIHHAGSSGRMMFGGASDRSESFLLRKFVWFVPSIEELGSVMRRRCLIQFDRCIVVPVEDICVACGASRRSRPSNPVECSWCIVVCSGWRYSYGSRGGPPLTSRNPVRYGPASRIHKAAIYLSRKPANECRSAILGKIVTSLP